MTNNNLSQQQISPLYNLMLAFIVLLLLTLTSTIFAWLNGFTASNATDNNLTMSSDALALSVFFSILLSYPLVLLARKKTVIDLIKHTVSVAIYWFLMAFILAITLAWLVQELMQYFYPQSLANTSIDSALKANYPQRLLLYISLIFLAPIFEELLFRGFIFDSFKHKYGFFSGLLVSSVVFTSFHLLEYHQYWIGLMAILGLAVILGLLRHYSRSLGPPIIAHITYNASLLFLMA